uniref:ZP domain-containing protein n=1 Tax=Angiostrongylus costaricensis TaxID=334426 RepID=A0A0R3Q2U6_ANGCS
LFSAVRQESKNSVRNGFTAITVFSRADFITSRLAQYNDSSRPFVSHWSAGKPEDVTLSCQVVGTDPTYGFPRICDQTPSIRVFQERVTEAFLIEIRGKCFNATVAIQKHIDRCPWCPDSSDVTLIEQSVSEGGLTAIFHLHFTICISD